MFTIEHLFMDFENADIAHYDRSRTSMPLPDGTSLSTGQLTQWQLAIENYFTGLAGSKNPYILGYTAATSNSPGGTPALFDPTGATFSTFRDAAAAGDNTLNFLLMTAGHAIPAVPPNGALSASPISSHDYDGAMVISPDIFIKGYLENCVLPAIDNAALVQAFTRNGNQWNASSSWDNKDLNDGYGQIVHTDIVNIYCVETNTRSATVTLITGNKPTIHVQGEFKINFTWTEYPFDISTWDGTATTTLSWTLDIVLSAGTNGTVAVTPAFNADKPITEKSDNGVQMMADLVGLGLGNALNQVQDWATTVENSDYSTMQAALTNALTMLSSRVVLPAGDVFFFSNATLEDDFGLRLDILYKASH
jgi:hypothetical protein